MFELNWAELLIIGFLALIVIGPEDLPDMFRQLGRFTAKLRQMSREFSRAMEDAAKQSGLKEAADDLKTATSSKSLGLDAVREAADKFEKWDPMKSAKPTTTMPARSLVPPPMPGTPATTAADVSDEDEAADDLAAHDLDAADHAHAGNTHPGASATVAQTAPPAVLDQNTQALYDKIALRSQVLQEQTEKLKAIEAGTYRAPSAAPAPASTPAPVSPTTEVSAPPVKRSAKAKPAAAAADAPPKPRAKSDGKSAAKAQVSAPTPDEPKKKASRKTASKADKT